MRRHQDGQAQPGAPVRPGRRGRLTLDTGASALAALLAERPDPDGVFAANDLMAHGAARFPRDQGRRVWTASRCRFDDSSAAPSCRPPLTTVRQPRATAGGGDGGHHGPAAGRTCAGYGVSRCH
ncbi:substrate-binding domain-containing protein [Streptomyces griseoluteus]|uniref:substrate-binding domain-containing protein n=1 Tax=Streptomyces griseoluteus TaxID=29306 RepID=UPI0038299A53